MPGRWTPRTWLVLALATLSGCAHPNRPMDPQQFHLMQQSLSESQTMRAETTRQCAAKQAARSGLDRAAMAALLEVTEAEVPQVLCRRLVEAVAAGAFTFEDFQSIRAGTKDPELLARLRTVVQAEPLDSI